MALRSTLILIILPWMTTDECEGTMKIRRIQPSKHNFYVFEGESIKVACEVSSQNVIKTIKWSFSLSSLSEDRPLANSTHTTIRNKWDSNSVTGQSVLEVSNVPKHYPKLSYRCTAEFNDSYEEQMLVGYYYIQEKSIPKVDISGSKVPNVDVTANASIKGTYNSTAQLKCIVDFHTDENMRNEHVSVELRKNGDVLEKENLEYRQANGTFLTYSINSMEVDDGGVYTCGSKMIIGERKFISTQYVNLTLPLRLMGISLKEVRSFPGHDVELVCDIEGFPTPKWTFQYGSEVVKNNANMTVVQNRLEIKHVQTHHHGLYTCIATDGDGNTKSQNISLKINKNCGRKNDSSLIVIYLLVHVYSFCFIGL